MKLFANIKSFAANESGAVTVDWVVLTAAIVGLGIAVIASVRTGTSNLAGSIQTSLTSASVSLPW
jgi:Flp pilus assembly pilin Flp